MAVWQLGLKTHHEPSQTTGADGSSAPGLGLQIRKEFIAIARFWDHIMDVKQEQGGKSICLVKAGDWIQVFGCAICMHTDKCNEAEDDRRRYNAKYRSLLVRSSVVPQMWNGDYQPKYECECKTSIVDVRDEVFERDRASDRLAPKRATSLGLWTLSHAEFSVMVNVATGVDCWNCREC